jgi:hypothetical protein
MNEATYCPEDNKLRLYVGRVSREEYEALRAEGWTSTPKQDCDFVATWSPNRRRTAMEYGEGFIGDEDQGPADRAADRAERFGDYRQKRLGEALHHADHYDEGPMAHGFQNKARAVRAADRHDRIAGRAVDAWSKAEYWQSRTAGVISHALYVSTPAVRMGRIKVLESEQRKHLAALETYKTLYRKWALVAVLTSKVDLPKGNLPVTPEVQTALATRLAGDTPGGYDFPHPITGVKSSLWFHLTDNTKPITGQQAADLWLAGKINPEAPEFEDSRKMQWARHYEMRLAYEIQMLEAQGGRAALLEMEIGGWVGSYQIWKVNKSNATGRVVSVQILAPARYGNTGKETFQTLNIERLDCSSYRAPTPDDLALIASKKADSKAARPKAAPCPLINPTDEDAERLQAIWNEREKDANVARAKVRGLGTPSFAPSAIVRLTQAQYSAAAAATYARSATHGICRNAELYRESNGIWISSREDHNKRVGSPVCKVRSTSSGQTFGGADRIIILTDKPRKPFPAAVWETIEALDAAPALA